MITMSYTKEMYIAKYVKDWQDWCPELSVEVITSCIENSWAKMVQPLIDEGKAEIILKEQQAE